MKVSILMLTIDRFELTSRVWKHNLAAARYKLDRSIELECLICDNGSQDRRIVDFYRPHSNPTIAYHRVNGINEGVGKAFNQLYLRSTGKFIAILGNDIEMPNGWLNRAIQMLTWIPKGGIMGFDWGHGSVPPISKRFNIESHWLTPQLNRVFGSWVFRRSMVEDMGLFYEGYGPYGIEDSDVNERLNRAGYSSCYIPNMRSQHLAHDVGQNSPYRKMKDESLGKNLTIFAERVKQWDKGEGSLKEPLPPLREPLNG